MHWVPEAFIPESGVSRRETLYLAAGRKVPFFAFREGFASRGRRTHRLNVSGKEAVFRLRGISLFDFFACNAHDRRTELQADGALTGKSL